MSVSYHPVEFTSLGKRMMGASIGNKKGTHFPTLDMVELDQKKIGVNENWATTGL